MILQCSIIFGCLFAGELAVFLTGVKIPSSIIGMLLLTALLQFRILRLEQVRDIAGFFSENLALFFVPPGVGIMLYLDVLRDEFMAIVLSSILSTLVVLALTAWVFRMVKKRND
jgi:holin-like protein